MNRVCGAVNAMVPLQRRARHNPSACSCGRDPGTASLARFSRPCFICASPLNTRSFMPITACTNPRAQPRILVVFSPIFYVVFTFHTYHMWFLSRFGADLSGFYRTPPHRTYGFEPHPTAPYGNEIPQSASHQTERHESILKKKIRTCTPHRVVRFCRW